jgi:hypothetical protein
MRHWIRREERRVVMGVKECVTGMMKENTGWSMLDSGYYYGRNYERHQGKALEDFERAPACRAVVDGRYLCLYYDLWHFLVDHLERDEECEEIERWLYLFSEDIKESWLACVEEFEKAISGRGEYGKGNNSYNFDTLLSQDIQWQELNLDSGDFVILQVHGGCDIRGGYTRPRVFRVTEIDSFGGDMREAEAWCDGCGRGWRSDDAGYSWELEEVRVREDNPVQPRLVDAPVEGDGTILMGSFAERAAEDERYNVGKEFVVDEEERKVLCANCGAVVKFGVNEGW